MTGPGRPGGLGIGDRVRFGGRDQVVIGVSGPAVRLADTGGEVVTVSVPGLLADGDFAVLDARPRPGMPAVSVLDRLPAEAVQEARWWQRHIVEVLTGIPPDAEDGTVPRPEYDPAVVTLTRREQAKAAELTAAGHPVTASAIAKRRRRYQEQGLAGMIDHRAGKRMPAHGRADAAVVAAMRQAISEAAGDSTRTAVFVLRRTRHILAESGGEPDGGMPSRSTLYRLFSRLQDGRHTTGSASTRRSLAGRPEGPFGQVPAAALSCSASWGSFPTPTSRTPWCAAAWARVAMHLAYTYLSPGVVKVQSMRALARLRALLGEDEASPPLPPEPGARDAIPRPPVARSRP